MSQFESGHLIAEIATGEIEHSRPDDGKDPAAVALGRKGGLKGGKARAESLSEAELREATQNAAQARWSNDKKTD